MWRFGLVSVLAVCLLPEATLSQNSCFTVCLTTPEVAPSQGCTTTTTPPPGLCQTCNPGCTVEIEKKPRKLHYFEGFLYYFESDNKKYTWSEGSAACKSIWQNANLASFHSIEEYRFIVSNMKETTVSAIGGIRVDGSREEWTWTDGTPLNMTLINNLWAPNQPDYQSRKENVMEVVKNSLDTGPNGGLNDVSPTHRRGAYTCKIPCTV